MATVSTRADVLGKVLKWIAHPDIDYHFDVVTLNVASAATLAVGTVLAKVTATGKYLVQDASLASGAGLEAAGILIGTDLENTGVTAAAATDVSVLMLARGPVRVAKGNLIMGAGTDTDAEKLAVYNTLAGLGIVADAVV